MSEIYNLRVGDMVWNVQQGHNVVGLIVKVTPKYAHYAICAGKGRNPVGKEDHFITRGHKTKKDTMYAHILDGTLSISYAGGTKRRRKIVFEDENR